MPEQTQAETPEPTPDVQIRRSRAERREQAAGDVLRTFVRDLHVSRFGAIPPKGEEIELTIRMKVRPSEDWLSRFDPPLVEQIGGQIEDVQAGWSVFRRGHVYCFRCDSSECEHGIPPSSLSVFQSYASNGLPEWIEFAQALVALQDPRVERLFAPRPDVIALVQLGRDLRDKQLSSFGRSSKTYAILGQVVAGYFLLPDDGEAPGRLGVTFQAVEARGENGKPCVRLNVLATLPDGEDIVDLLGSGWQDGLHRARELAVREVESIEQRVITAQGQRDAEGVRVEMRRIPGVLRRLAESLERSSRQAGRRTKHVEERRQDRRPVHKALDDARSATRQSLFYDEKAGTSIVCGPQGRAHAFNADGRHVTSFVLNPGSVAFRLRTRRWRELTPDESVSLKERIEGFVPKTPDASAMP